VGGGGQKYIFLPPQYMPSLLVGYTQFCIAGLQESSREEPNMSKTPLGKLIQCYPDPKLVGHLPQYRPSPKPCWALRTSSSPCPRNA